MLVYSFERLNKMGSTVTLADYLFTRLRQLGVKSMFGVPGDYNLSLLDYVEPAGLHWIGNCNELNAGYAADAYSRLNGLGSLITTFGVGELSAINAIAGAFAERAPVVHIVGTPNRQTQDSRTNVHHTFNDGEYGRFALIHAHITVAQANLLDPRTAPELIDNTIQQCMIHSRPVYIQIPVDLVDATVSSERLSSDIQLPQPSPSKDQEPALTSVLKQIYASERPMILVDGESRAFNMLDEVHQLVKSTNWPTFTSTFGKGLVDESWPNVHGIWKGSFASKEDQAFGKSRDLILCFGPHFSTTNSYQSAAIPDPNVTISFTATTIRSKDKIYRDIPAKRFLSLLLQKLDSSKLKKVEARTSTEASKPETTASGPITQDKFYQVLKPLLRSNDIVLAETGTAAYGCREMRLPPNTRLFTAVTWLSIGYMLPAALGAALAQRDHPPLGISRSNETGLSGHANGQEHSPRTVLLIGDGSFQMTAQELSTIIRENLNVVIILINNKGYTIERCLHGWKQKYNDIAPWRYLEAASFMGAGLDGAGDASSFTAKTWGDLEKVLADDKIKNGKGLTMVEVFMDWEDAPEPLAGMLQNVKRAEN